MGEEEEEEPVLVPVVVAVPVVVVVIRVSTYHEDVRSDRQSVELQCKSSFLQQRTCQHREVG